MSEENNAGSAGKRGEAERRNRQARQAAALRDNLYRRKSQARARREFDTSNSDMTANVAAAERPIPATDSPENKES